MLKIGIYADYRFVSGATPAGVSKHMCYMVKGLAGDERFNLSGLAAADQRDALGALSFLPCSALPLSFKTSRELWSCLNAPKMERWCDGLEWIYCPNDDLIAVKKIKYAATFHGAPDLDRNFAMDQGVIARSAAWKKKLRYRKIVQRADLILVVSEWLKNLMAEQQSVDPERMAVVGNGVNESFFEAGRQRLQGPAGLTGECESLYVLAVGGLNRIDGGDYVVQLAQAMQRAGAKFRIKVAGSHNEPELVALAQTSGVVDLLGHVDEAEIVRLMSKAQLLYFPSRYETFGITVAEAMASGCPVVSSRCTALPEIVSDCGIYVEPQRSDDVLDCVTDIVENGSRTRELCARAYERAVAHYTWGRCVERLAESLIERS